MDRFTIFGIALKSGLTEQGTGGIEPKARSARSQKTQTAL